MAVLVGRNEVRPFTTPVVRSNGMVDANEVRGNDAVLRTRFNAHDADDTIHNQAGTLLERPATAGEGATWTDSATMDRYVYWGGQWLLAAIAPWDGAFYSTASQTAGTVNTAVQTTMNTTAFARGITQASNALTFAYAGTYKVEVKHQLVNTDSQAHAVWVWARLNGTAIPYAGRRVSAVQRHGGTDGKTVSVGFFSVTVAAGDVLTFWWETEDLDVSLQALAAGTNRSAAPSFSAVITRI